MNLRRVEVDDLVKLHTCNLFNIQENYGLQFWMYMILSWPELSFLAEDGNGKVVGYVLSSVYVLHFVDERIDFIALGRQPYRRLGLAQKLMNLSQDAMFREDPQIEYIQLHVRKSNHAARSLYEKLGYKYHQVDEKYYADEEDAFIMRFPIRSRDEEQQQRPSSDTRIPPRKTWIANVWQFVLDRLHRLAEATISLLRKRKSPP